MRKITLPVYLFTELSTDAQQTAVEYWANVDKRFPEWSADIIAQAAECGIEILDYNGQEDRITIRLTESADKVASKITLRYPNNEQMQKAVKGWLHSTNAYYGHSELTKWIKISLCAMLSPEYISRTDYEFVRQMLINGEAGQYYLASGLPVEDSQMEAEGIDFPTLYKINEALAHEDINDSRFAHKAHQEHGMFCMSEIGARWYAEWMEQYADTNWELRVENGHPDWESTVETFIKQRVNTFLYG